MSDYFFYDLNKKMADLANKQQLAETAQATPAKPAPNRLMEAAADYSAKKAAAGKDIGKPGKNFSKIAAGAAKKYGSAEAGKRVAGAVLNKLRHTEESVEPPKHYGPPGQPSVGTAKFDRYMQQRRAEHEATRPVPIKPPTPGTPTKESVNQAQLKPYKSTMKEGGKPDFLDLDKDGNRKEPMKSAARSAKKVVDEGMCSACDCNPCKCHSMDESALQAAFGKKKYGDQGMKALQKAGRNNAGDATMNKIRNRYDKYDEGVMDTLKKGYNKVTNTLGDIGIIPPELISPRRDKNGNWNKRTNTARNNFIDWIEDNPGLESHMAELLANFDNWVDDGNSDRAAGKKAVEMWKQRMKREKQSVSEPMRRHSMTEVNATPHHLDDPVSKPMAKASAANRSSSKRPDPNVPGSMIVVGKDTGPLPKRKTPTSAPDDEDGSTAPPAKGPDGRYPIVTDGPNKGKRWSPATPGPTRAGMKESGAAPGGPGDYNYIKDNYQNVTLNGRIIGTTADGGKTFISSRPAEFKSGAMPQGATVDSNKQKIKPMGDYEVDEGGVPMTPKQKKFAALAPPFNKISFADKIVGAKKEVDEMLGDVAASAMKKAVRGRNRGMEEPSDWSKLHEPFKAGDFDDTPTSRKSNTSGRVDTSKTGSTVHYAGKNYSGAGHDVDADDEPSGQIGRRRVGAGQGKKIGAKINRGTSKLMTKKGDITDEDMFEPRDSGEYDQEGDMAKDTIKTVVRHAQALEKILGDDDNLPEWVQSKLAKIENMMTAVDDYMQNQQDDEMPMEEERTNKRDSRAEKAGRKVAKDIEYDEKKKDGIHGKRRGSEDSRAERAGKKVTKDIEYDEKKDKKKKEVDETTTSGSVATGGAAPKSGVSMKVGTGIYDSLNRQLENMISEGMNINMSMNNDEHGGPRKSLTVTATDEDAVMLAGLLKMAGMGSGDEHMHDMTDNDSQMLAIQTMGDEDACSSCGSSPCGCDDQMMDEDRWGAEQPPKLPNDMTVTADGGVDVKKSGSDWVYKSKEPGGRVTVTIPAKAANKMLPNTEMDEAYGDTDATENEPDYPTDEVGTADEGMYSGGLDGPKSTGQTTIPVIAGQDDRMGYNGDHELRRMMEIAGLR